MGNNNASDQGMNTHSNAMYKIETDENKIIDECAMKYARQYKSFSDANAKAAKGDIEEGAARDLKEDADKEFEKLLAFPAIQKLIARQIYKYAGSRNSGYLSHGNTLLQKEDFEQSAIMAIHQAAMDFDQSKSNHFITYAFTDIKKYIIKRIAEEGFNSKIPRKEYEKYRKIEATLRELEKEFPENSKEMKYLLASEELGKGFSVEEILKIQNDMSRLMDKSSLNKKVGQERGNEKIDLIVAKDKAMGPRSFSNFKNLNEEQKSKMLLRLADLKIRDPDLFQKCQEEFSEKFSGCFWDNIQKKLGKGLRDKIQLLYTYDILTKLGSIESIKSVKSDIVDALSNSPESNALYATLNNPKGDFSWQFNDHLPRGPMDRQGIKMSSNDHKLQEDIEAIWYALDRKSFLNELKTNEDGKIWLHYKNDASVLRDSDCIILASLVLWCFFLTKEEKKNLLERIMRLSTKRVQEKIQGMYLNMEKHIPNSDSDKGAIIEKLLKAILGERDNSGNLVHYQVALLYGSGNPEAEGLENPLYSWDVITPLTFSMFRGKLYLVCTLNQQYKRDKKTGKIHEVDHSKKPDERIEKRLPLRYNLSNIHAVLTLNNDNLQNQIQEAEILWGEKIADSMAALSSSMRGNSKRLRDIDDVVYNYEDEDHPYRLGDGQKVIDEAVQELGRNTFNGFVQSGHLIPITILYNNRKFYEKLRDVISPERIREPSKSQTKGWDYQVTVDIRENAVKSLYHWLSGHCVEDEKEEVIARLYSDRKDINHVKDYAEYLAKMLDNYKEYGYSVTRPRGNKIVKIRNM